MKMLQLEPLRGDEDMLDIGRAGHSASHLDKMCGASTSQRNRRLHFNLSGQLSFNSQFQRAGDNAAVSGPVTHSGFRIFGKLSEKLSDPKSAVFISWAGNMLPPEQGVSF
ncbi:hypothetical protein CHARACLAT_021431 [Characodon lateralis]|uniref:Uncharacterized protein n=1 Tax=Characodon lateralis TaxID=208331 RepID=A0ABU7DWJ7_9TELE|nr:hypothetical protein [Characodon lateralis]